MENKKRIVVLGDLHYEPADHKVFNTIGTQILKKGPEALFSLGDVGGYSHCGSRQSFLEAKDFFSAFGIPYYTLLGNHDLEGKEFKTDSQNIEAWLNVFGYPAPYHSVMVGGTLCICLSSTRFRESPNCWHEIHLDPGQILWLRRTLGENKKTPTFIFCHVPILGSGLRVIQSIHFRYTNAYLNHTDNPGQFLQLLKDNPQVKLWFSGHNHLGQDYADSISVGETCTFVHVGVIGRVSRDGRFQSRFIDFNETGCEILTLDHLKGDLRTDLKLNYTEDTVEQFPLPTPPDANTLGPPPAFPKGREHPILGNSLFLEAGESLIEYDLDTESPIGVVVDRLNGRKPVVRENGLFLDEPGGDSVPVPRGVGGRFMKCFWRGSRR